MKPAHAYRWMFPNVPISYEVAFTKPKLGDMDTELFKEWFQAFAQAAGITLHIENLYGENNHHIVELFQGLARALRAPLRSTRANPMPCRPPRVCWAADRRRGRGDRHVNIAIIDYGSGNLRSAEKAFARCAPGATFMSRATRMSWRAPTILFCPVSAPLAIARKVWRRLKDCAPRSRRAWSMTGVRF